MKRPAGEVDRFGCLGSTIRVASGYLDLANPRPEDIDLASIALGLSNECRFAGQCPQFYSVAEHCVQAVCAALRDGVEELVELQAILLHDAAEAFLKDVPKPLKLLLGEAYQQLEQTMQDAITRRFSLPQGAFEWDIVRHYDRAMLVLEKNTFWPADREVWPGFSDVQPARTTIDCRSPPIARHLFHGMASQLKIA